MLYKATETLRVFSRRRPSLGTLWRNRRQFFDRAHGILPSTAATGESLELILQAWDQCERLIADFDGRFRLDATDPDATDPDATDPDATYPDAVDFPPRNGGVETAGDIAFETPGVQYLTVTHVDTGEQFVSNPVCVTANEPEERVFWRDVHLHSNLSDGSGSMAEGFRFGRNEWLSTSSATPTTTRWGFSSRRGSSAAGCTGGTSAR